MKDRNQQRHGVQRGVKRHDSTTTASDGSMAAAGPANERRQEELVHQLPDSFDDAQERGERNDAAKAIATGGKARRR